MFLNHACRRVKVLVGEFHFRMVKHAFSNTYKIYWIELRNVTPFKVRKEE